MVSRIYKLPLVLHPEPEGGYSVTSPLLPELFTAGASIDEALENVRDAVAAVIELYDDLNKKLPDELLPSDRDTIVFEHVLAAE